MYDITKLWNRLMLNFVKQFFLQKKLAKQFDVLPPF